MAASSLMLSLYLILIILQPQLCSSGNCSKCIFNPHLNLSNALVKLQPFCGKRFSLEEPGRPSIKYIVGICTPVLSRGDTDVVLKNDRDNSTVIGNLSMADVMTGDNWVMLQYGNSTGSRAIIMITCNIKAPQPPAMRFVGESSDKPEGCFHMFELEDASLCTTEAKVTQSHLSAGSILCIIFFTLVSVYLIGGFIIQRFFRGAKGANQIPNLEFWKELGNLVADGCDFVCRCNRGRDSYQEERGPRCLVENASDHVDIDDRLLGM